MNETDVPSEVLISDQYLKSSIKSLGLFSKFSINNHFQLKSQMRIAMFTVVNMHPQLKNLVLSLMMITVILSCLIQI